MPNKLDQDQIQFQSSEAMYNRQNKISLSKCIVLALSFLFMIFILTGELASYRTTQIYDNRDHETKDQPITQKQQDNKQKQTIPAPQKPIPNKQINLQQPIKKQQQSTPVTITPIKASIPKKQIPLQKQQTQQKVKKIKQLQQEAYKKFPNVIKIDAFNVEKAGQNFGQALEFSVKLQGVSKFFNNFDNDKHDQVTPIQVASPLDFTTISSVVDFKKLDKMLTDSIAHQVIRFQANPKLEKQKQYIKYENQQVQNQVKSFANSMGQNQQHGFAIQLAKNPQDNRLKQKQYQYYNKKYNIGSITEQSPICIYSAGYKIFSKNRYKLFFETVERQNYTNFQIVYVDDNSPDQSAYKIFQYLHSTKTRLNNRISIVHNLQHIGALGNMYFWIRKYCSQDSIVVIIDGDDSIIGHQVFQVLNSVYKKQSNWYVYSRYVSHYPQSNRYLGGASSPFYGSTATYRTMERVWTTSHIRTFRKKLMDVVPIEHMLEYHYNSQTKLAWPRLFDYAPDRFQAYSQIQLAGDDRLVYISDYLYLYDATVGVIANKCYRQHQFYDEYKSRIKTPLKRLKDWGEPVKFTQNYVIPQNVLNTLGQKYHEYKLCGQKSIY